ncbi:MAG: serine hydrolase, partial [Bacteroidota bacterium]
MPNFSRYLSIFFLAISLNSCKQDQGQDNSETNTPSTKYDNFVSEMKANGFATGNILVYEDGEIIHQSSNGLRNINPIDSLNLDSQFRLASVSKQFTGLAIMKLKVAGKLDYDQKVNTILTDFPYDNISVRHLLYHTSGLADYTELMSNNWKPADTSKTYILGNDEVLKEFYKESPDLYFEPNEKWEYSNTGYLVLASIVEKISGMHFREFLNKELFEPLGMENTELYKYQIEPDVNKPQRVFGYGLALNQTDRIDDDYNLLNDVRGDGGIYSTLKDLYTWNMALANASVLPKEELKEAFIPGKLNNGEYHGYGFGFFVDSNQNEPLVVSHSGGWVGFATYLQNEIDAKSGFVLLTNNSGEGFGATLRAIDSIGNGKTYELLKKDIRSVLAKTIYDKGIDAAIEEYKVIKSNKPEDYAFSEGQINRLGYELLGEDMADEALAIFELNTQEYPESGNVYDSYADALLVKGDSTKALQNFSKAFKIDSTLSFSKEKMESLEKA